MVLVETQVLIIGAGATGTGLARDLALRGVDCIVVEARDINAGASGANHGLLHSGARYVSNDPASARACAAESLLLKRLAPGCIEDTGGLFVAVPGDDEGYIAEFPGLCAKSGIPVRPLRPQEALEREPELARTLIAAYEVQDASINPFTLSLENMAQAESLGARLLTHTEVTGFDLGGGRIEAVRLRRPRSDKEEVVRAEQVVNATGACAGAIAALAGLELPMIYSKGTLVVTQTRVTQRVINRLRAPGDGDIVTPGGTVSVAGTTSLRLDRPGPCRPTMGEVDFLVAEAGKMVPLLDEVRYVRAYAGIRPLVAPEAAADDRAVSRGFVVLDHEAEGLRNFTTVTGGKLTMFRLMAETAADLVCSRLGVTEPCRTRVEPLGPNELNRWTEPGEAPRVWLQRRDPGDALLCECEMVPTSAVDQIMDHLAARGEPPDINALGLRSRVGKGSCQGAFCGVRISARLYQRGAVNSEQGLGILREFLERRWRGLRPVLWGPQLAQEELQEALHCGLFALEL
jgi:glycerol-3-phosphate dehydrogenase